MIGKNTEKAIRAWLKLPNEDRFISTNSELGRIDLNQYNPDGPIPFLHARFTVKSILAKRYPKRKRKLPKNNPGRVD